MHPKNKIIIGQRLANLALAHTYKYKINADYPSFKYYKKKEKRLMSILTILKHSQREIINLYKDLF